MENVKGFECSNTRDEFVRVLQSLGYKFQEFLLSPSQFGIPNSRLRYYLLAKKKPLTFAHEEHSGVGQQSPITDPEIIIKALQSNMQSLGSPSCNKDIEDSIKACKQLSHYLQDLDDEVISEYLVPDKILSKYAMALDIVRTTSANSCCFTKGYGNYASISYDSNTSVCSVLIKSLSYVVNSKSRTKVSWTYIKSPINWLCYMLSESTISF